MKAADRRRAATLLQALSDLPSITRAAKQRAPKNPRDDRRGLLMTIEDIDEGSGSSCDGNGIELDLDTVPLVVAAVRTIIRDELKRLGVKP